MSTLPPDDPTRRVPPPTPPYGTPSYGFPPPALPPDSPPIGVPPPPGSPGPPVQQRRGGCRGCLLTCLTVVLVCALLAVVVVAASVYMIRQAFPVATTVREAATCAGLRVLVNNADAIVERGNGTPAQKAEMRRAFQELRTKYERECAPPAR